MTYIILQANERCLIANHIPKQVVHVLELDQSYLCGTGMGSCTETMKMHFISQLQNER